MCSSDLLALQAKFAEIEAHNAGNSSYTMGINEFSDLTWFARTHALAKTQGLNLDREEFSATYLGFAPSSESTAPAWTAPRSNRITADVDWSPRILSMIGD